VNALPTALNNLAWYETITGQPDKAEPIAREALGILPGNQYIADTLGYILLQLQRYREAADVYQSFIDLDLNRQPPIALRQPPPVGPARRQAAPDYLGGGPRYRYAQVLMELGQKKEAEVLSNSAKDYVPTHEIELVGADPGKRCPAGK
jgi:tetratricopeptide (TPR) repeat protein